MFSGDSMEKVSIRHKRIQELKDFYRWLAVVRRKLELQEDIPTKNVNQKIADFFREHPYSPQPPKEKKGLQSKWAKAVINILSAFGTGSGIASTLVTILVHFHLLAAGIVFTWAIPIAIVVGYVFYQSRSKVANGNRLAMQARMMDVELIILKLRMHYLKQEHHEIYTTYLRSLNDCTQIISPGSSAQNTYKLMGNSKNLENKMLNRLEKLSQSDPERLPYIKSLLLERQKSIRLKKKPINKPHVFSKPKQEQHVKLKSLGSGASLGVLAFGLIISIIAAIKITTGLSILALSGPYGWAIIAAAIAIGITIGISVGAHHYIKLRRRNKKKRDLSEKKRKIWKILKGIAVTKSKIHKIQKKSKAIYLLKQQYYIDLIKKASILEEKSVFAINSAISILQLSQAIVSHPDCLTLYAPIKKQLLTVKETLTILISQSDYQQERIQGLPSHLFSENKSSFERCLLRYQALHKQAKQQVSDIDVALAAIDLQEQQKTKAPVLPRLEGDHQPQYDYHKNRNGLFTTAQPGQNPINIHRLSEDPMTASTVDC